MKKVFLLAVAFMIFMIPVTEARELVFVAEDELSSVYLDSDSIEIDPNHSGYYFRVLTFHYWTEEGKKALLEAYTSESSRSSSWVNKVSYSICRVYFKNSNGKLYADMLGDTIFCDVNGNAVKKFYSEYYDWEEVEPGTVAEKIYKTALRYKD